MRFHEVLLLQEQKATLKVKRIVDSLTQQLFKAVTSYTFTCVVFSLNEALQYKTEHLFAQTQTQHFMTKTHITHIR